MRRLFLVVAIAVLLAVEFLPIASAAARLADALVWGLGGAFSSGAPAQLTTVIDEPIDARDAMQ